MRFHKIVIIFSMLTALPVASALACFHQPSCFTRCAQLPLWEVPFCDLGTMHTPALQNGNLKIQLHYIPHLTLITVMRVYLT